jgi:hypothetical protein
MSESTEAKLLQAANTIFAHAEAQGAEWKPPNEIAKLDRMGAKIAAGVSAQSSLDTAAAAEENLRNQRKPLGESVLRMMPGLVRYLKSAGLSAEDRALVQSLNRGLRGDRSDNSPPAADGATPARRRISVAQTANVSRVAKFSEIIAFLVEKEFKSTEERYTVETLTARRNEWNTLNGNIETAVAATDAGEQLRDDIFYLDSDSLVDTLTSARDYILSTNPRGSQIYQAVIKLEFRAPKRLAAARKARS